MGLAFAYPRQHSIFRKRRAETFTFIHRFVFVGGSVFAVSCGGRAGTMMVTPPSSVSFITCGSKSSGTPVGSGNLTGCLRSFFTCAPLMRKISAFTVPQPGWDCALLLSNSSDCISRGADTRTRARRGLGCFQFVHALEQVNSLTANRYKVQSGRDAL